MAQYSLETLDNYLETYDVSESEMFSKYVNLISEFTSQAQTSIAISNLEYYKYVIIKGIETITHVFRMLLLYTKNIELSYYNCKKALYYYIEFIGQIGEDNHEFLKLTSKDASLFVYKKTIFSIQNSFRKEYKEDEGADNIKTNNTFHMTELFLSVYKAAINEQVCETNSQVNEALMSLKNYIKELVNLSLNRPIETLHEKLTTMLIYNDTVNGLTGYVPIEYHISFLKKLDKNIINDENLKDRLSEHIEKIGEYTARKFVNLLV
uniref:Uncharacterized protein n=1 Tax=viral metagenome TaxID=1070528 RepID=A0A6C0CS46_9ZZZZ